MVAGIQGIAVRMPTAAAVAAPTCGFNVEVHMPNGAMSTHGFELRIDATGVGVAATEVVDEMAPALMRSPWAAR